MVVCELDNVIEIEMQEFGSAPARDWLEFGIDPRAVVFPGPVFFVLCQLCQLRKLDFTKLKILSRNLKLEGCVYYVC